MHACWADGRSVAWRHRLRARLQRDPACSRLLRHWRRTSCGPLVSARGPRAPHPCDPLPLYLNQPFHQLEIAGIAPLPYPRTPIQSAHQFKETLGLDPLRFYALPGSATPPAVKSRPRSCLLSLIESSPVSSLFISPFHHQLSLNESFPPSALSEAFYSAAALHLQTVRPLTHPRQLPTDPRQPSNNSASLAVHSRTTTPLRWFF